MELVRQALHLTYCLNVHPGEDWPGCLKAIEEYALKVKAEVSPARPFGLGLRLSALAARQLAQPAALSAFKQFLAANRLYVFTINGFPYGRFHNGPVKADVYKPDWYTQTRYDYTLCLIDILAGLLPGQLTGSISTVPCAYREEAGGEERDRRRLLTNLTELSYTLCRYRRQQGKEIVLALEPEPDCYLGSTAETIRFFIDELFPFARTYLKDKYGLDDDIASRYVGVCFDTCHLAVEFEEPVVSLHRLQEAGIRIGKIQLSAAVRTHISPATLTNLGLLGDSVYLHQTRIKVRGEEQLRCFKDLTPETLQAAGQWPGAELRTHVHVPLYFQEYAGLFSTAYLLTPAFLEQAVRSGVPHCELETYTFDVLPPRLKEKTLIDSVSAEYRWILKRFSG